MLRLTGPFSVALERTPRDHGRHSSYIVVGRSSNTMQCCSCQWQVGHCWRQPIKSKLDAPTNWVNGQRTHIWANLTMWINEQFFLFRYLLTDIDVEVNRTVQCIIRKNPTRPRASFIIHCRGSVMEYYSVLLVPVTGGSLLVPATQLASWPAAAAATARVSLPTNLCTPNCAARSRGLNVGNTFPPDGLRPEFRRKSLISCCWSSLASTYGDKPLTFLWPDRWSSTTKYKPGTTGYTLFSEKNGLLCAYLSILPDWQTLTSSCLCNSSSLPGRCITPHPDACCDLSPIKTDL